MRGTKIPENCSGSDNYGDEDTILAEIPERRKTCSRSEKLSSLHEGKGTILAQCSRKRKTRSRSEKLSSLSEEEDDDDIILSEIFKNRKTFRRKTQTCSSSATLHSHHEDDNIIPSSEIPRRHKTCSRPVTISSLNEDKGVILSDFRKIQSCSSCSSAVKLPSLHEDIVAEIFARLPVKSLLRFRCVSKYWNSFISSKQFVKTHLEIWNTNFARHSVISRSSMDARTILKHCSLQSLFYEQQAATYATDIYCPTSNPRRDHISVAGCVNGLCCIVLNMRDIVLWNPSTRKYKKLRDMDCTEKTMFLGNVGFGLENGSDDGYKVLCIGFVESVVVAAMYTLKTDSWRIVQNMKDCFRFKRFKRFDNGKFVCGKLHWLTKDHDIVSFDLGTEVEGLVDQPPSSNVGRDGGTFTPSLGKLGGSLCLVLDYPRTSKEVWVLKDYGIKESWVKVVTIPDNPYPWNSSILGWKDFTPLCVSIEGKILFVCGSTFIIYNPKDDAFRSPHICNFPQLEELANDSGFLKVIVNIQSLVSPFPDAW